MAEAGMCFTEQLKSHISHWLQLLGSTYKKYNLVWNKLRRHALLKDCTELRVKISEDCVFTLIMLKLNKMTNLFISTLRFSRKISLSAYLKTAYECDGKTTATILNKEPGYGVMIDSYSKEGFRLNNGLFVLGPMILFPHTALSWNVAGDHDIHKNSLAVFNLIEPKLDLLVIGYGKKSTSSRTLHEEIMKFKSKERLNVEVLPVEKAAATFNYLTSERRWVAGAFIPPEVVQLYATEEYTKLAKKKETFMVDDYI